MHVTGSPWVATATRGATINVDCAWVRKGMLAPRWREVRQGPGMIKGVEEARRRVHLSRLIVTREGRLATVLCHDSVEEGQRRARVLAYTAGVLVGQSVYDNDAQVGRC